VPESFVALCLEKGCNSDRMKKNNRSDLLI
jgi:hypothetical protein